MKSYDIEQNTPLWELARCGMVTASVMKIVCAKGQGSTATSVQRDRLKRFVLDELYRQTPRVTWKGGQMDKGHELEPEARDAYQVWLEDEGEELTVRPAGFYRTQIGSFGHRLIGASPDGLVYQDPSAPPLWGVQIKSCEGHIMLEIMERNEVPPEHRLQVQTELFVTGLPRWDVGVYCPGYPLQVFRVEPDPDAFSQIKQQTEFFYKEVESKCLQLFGETLKTLRDRLDKRIKDELGTQLQDMPASEPAPEEHVHDAT